MRGKPKDLAGQRFGRLVAVRVVQSKPRRWLCRCDCGNERIVSAGNLLSRNSQSCGCLGKEALSRLRSKDISNQRFGRLVALEPTDTRPNGNIVWRCRCDCGNEKLASSGDLVQGKVASCGCLGRKIADVRGQRFGRLVAVEPTERRSGSSVVWKCVCDCGRETFASVANLKKGATRSCGCLSSGKRKYQRVGMEFGHLAVVSEIGTFGGRNGLVLCECDCGRKAVRGFGSLRNYSTAETSCGRLHGRPRRSNAADLAGKRFGRLLVMREEGSSGSGGLLWRCLCECGRTCVVGTKELRNGNTSSCGCGNDENRARNMRARSDAIHVDGTNLASIASGKLRPDNKTGVRGVYRTKSGRYKAAITFQGRTKYLGTFDELADAAEARREAEQELFDPVLEAHGLEPTSEAEYEEALRKAVDNEKTN